MRNPLATIWNKIKNSLLKFPHDCFTCKWFTMRTEKPHIKVCRYPKGIVLKGEICQIWELQPDPKKRVRSFIQ